MARMRRSNGQRCQGMQQRSALAGGIGFHIDALILGVLHPTLGPCHDLVAVEPNELLDSTMRDAQRLTHLLLRKDVEGQSGHIR